MGRREKLRPKLDREAVEEHDRVAAMSPPEKSRLSSDDEANEDLSLRIVEKSLLIRAAKLVPENDAKVSAERVEAKEAKSKTKKVVIRKVIKKVIKKKKKIGDQNEEDKPESDKVVDVPESVEPKPVEGSDNIVLRKLLRGPRYFDPPDSSWGACYNCGEGGHTAVNCTAARRKKPCFVCGSFEHTVKQCTKGQDCFICKKTGHRAKDCPDKYKSSSVNSKICLKCGDSGHDMFSCRTDYYYNDVKEITCYVCKKPGHLCCADFVNLYQREVSCYRCGQMGHTGLSCAGLNLESTGTESTSTCYRCGEGGHFARECHNSLKNGKRNREPSTPTLRPHKEPKHSKGHKSAPHDLGKVPKRKKSQHQVNDNTTPRKSKHRGGWIIEDPGDNSTPRNPKHRGDWITEDPGDYVFDRSRNSGWRSPTTPRGHRISYHNPGSHLHTSQSSKHTRYAYGTPHFQGQPNGFYHFHNSGYSDTRFGYPGSGGAGGSGGWNNRSYGW